MVTTVAVGVDGSATAAEAVKMAAEVAGRFEAELVLLSAYKHAGTTRVRATAVTRSWNGRRVPCHGSARWSHGPRRGFGRRAFAAGRSPRRSDPADVLVRLAKQCGADILVVGNKGMQRRVRGSVPNSVTHTAECSVLVVKTT